MRKALISVSNKSNLQPFVEGLIHNGFEIYSTGGTYNAIESMGFEVKSVSDLTQFNEIMDGRVKTLHPNIHGGILADRNNDNHLKDLKNNDIELIDLVCVNLYPFKETVSKEDVTETDAIENIDIGGPTMLRAAAKNFKHVITVVDPNDYATVIEKLSNNTLSEEYRKHLMIKVFKHTNDYDQAIVNYFAQAETVLRYGENPHQDARIVKTTDDKNTILNAELLNGKPMSYNNIRDAESAFTLVKKFDNHAVVAVKHMNPCGVGIGDTIYDAYVNAYHADSKSIFGGIIALNSKVDKQTAEEMSKIFLEVIIAPEYDSDALHILKQKQNLRVLKVDFSSLNNNEEFVSVSGGYLVQTIDNQALSEKDIKVVTNMSPNSDELQALKLAWEVVKSVKSNAIVLANKNQTVGIGAGQMNRVGALDIAIQRAMEFLGHRNIDVKDQIVMASDGFFPMPDSVELAHKHNIHAVIQPGGSKRDQESIDYCNENNMSMIFTGIRHFKH